MAEHTPTPWELIEATEHHGAYIVNSWGRTVCDLYAMSNPMAASVRNGGNSFPVHFDDMAANAAFIVKAVNMHQELLDIVGRLANGERSEPGHSALRDAAIEALAKVASHV